MCIKRQVFGVRIQFRFEEFSATVEDTAESTLDLTENFGSLADAAEEAVAPVRAFQDALEGAQNVADRINELGASAFDRLSDALTDFVTTGRFQIRDFASFVIQEFIRIQIRSALARSLTSVGFGGFLQQGGPAQAGQAYIVGEAGPELFVPNVNGNVIPNEQLNSVGGGNTNITYEIRAVDARSFQQLAASDPSFLHNIVQRGARANAR